MKVIIILLNLVIFDSFIHLYRFNSSNFNDSEFGLTNDYYKTSSLYQENIIIFFNKSSYNNSVISVFESYGGVVKTEWNDLFSSFSGFSGIMPSESNLNQFQTAVPDANVEHNEILQTQMNYASIQTGGFNSSWYLNGYKGNTNCSIAVLDTGINPTHDFFPNGYDPLDLNGSIVGWDNFVNNDPILDDNGHGTFISSIISGTGTYPYKSNIPITVNINRNYSHTELFKEYTPAKNYSVKLFSFNASKRYSEILINSSWNWEIEGIDRFWVELLYNDEIVGYSENINTDQIYIINYSIPRNRLGIYDLYVKYHKQLQSKPEFLFNTSIRYFAEEYRQNYSYFTGIANATKLVGYKILNQSGIGYSSDLISALAHVIKNRTKYHILSVCLSVGTFGEDIEAINKAINEVSDNGVLVVIATGNSGIKTSDSMNKIAKNKNAIVVGAVNDQDQVTSYSSMGKNLDNMIKPDIVAPGGSKLSGHRTIITAHNESERITSNYGTSIATAIVSAAINLLIEAKWDNWTEWNNLNLTKWAKYIKATLLMTASETNLEREDDPFTPDDEGEYSPGISTSPLTTGLKDMHEGYGRLNIQAAIDALVKNISVNTSVSESLVSSQDNPLGTHVFARKIELMENKQYLFDLSVNNWWNSDFDMYLFSNQSTKYGEPILLQASRKSYGDLDYFYFTPMKNQTNCIIIVKAIEGDSTFTVNITTVKNFFEPNLGIPEINHVGGSKNTTIMSLQEYSGENPQKNYSIDSYRFYIEYFDNDSSNVPPQQVYVWIKGDSKNYALSQLYPQDNNYSDGALFGSNYIQFSKFGIFQYAFIASDGKFSTRYPKTGFLNITIEFPTDSIQFPSHYSFNNGIGNWTVNGTGWSILKQLNTNDNRSRIYQNSWNSFYFGTYHNFPKNYTYQSIKLTEDPYPNGSLTSPLFNLTQINKHNTQPFARYGLRVSINSGDYVYLQINLNWTGWQTIKTYTGEERDWFIDEVNLTDYLGNFVQFRYETSLDDTSDPINYKGFILDYFAIENYTNEYSPTLKFSLKGGIANAEESKFHQFTFSCEYYDLDNNYPAYIYLEMNDNNYTMYNKFGDWNANPNIPGDFGILFTRSLILHEILNQSFRFHISDGRFSNTTQWFNEDNSLFEFIKPTPLEFNLVQDNKLIGYEFSNDNLSDYYITGSPTPKENNAWLQGDNTWHFINRFRQQMIYGGRGLSFGGNIQGYGTNWDAKLITKPLKLKSEYNIYLEFDFEISLQNEFYQPEDQLDKCNISISQDFGESWSLLKEFTYESEKISGTERIDVSQYSGETVMIMFTLHSNGVVVGLGYGWLLYNIYIGYKRTADFIPPEIVILNPINKTTIQSMIAIEATISDNVGLDESKIYVFLNDKSVDRSKLVFNSNTSKLMFNWDTNHYDDGNYEIKIVANDKEGNTTEEIIIVKVNNMRWWRTWSPYIILISSVIVAGIVLYLFAEKKGKIWVNKIKENRVEKIRLSNIDRDLVIKRVELIAKDEVEKPLTLHCKYCKSWFLSKEFDIICPICEHDQIYTAYFCSNCNKLYLKDEPGKNYYCKNKGCIGVRLIPRKKEEIQEFLAQEGRILRKFEKKRDKFSILDRK